MALQGNATLSPREVLSLMAHFGEVWGALPEIKLVLVMDKGKEPYYSVTLLLEMFDEGKDIHVPFTASSRFPNSSHTSMLGLWVWLAHSIDNEVHAYRTLSGRRP